MSDADVRDHLDRQAELIDALFEHHDSNDKGRRTTTPDDGIWKGSPFGPSQGQRVAKEDGDDDDLEAAELLIENTERLEELVVERLDLDAGEKSRLTTSPDEKVWGDGSPFAGGGRR
jgi:hypothetical protein